MTLKERKEMWEHFKKFLEEKGLLEEYLYLLRGQFGVGLGDLKTKHVWAFIPREYCKKIPWVLADDFKKWVETDMEWRDLIEKRKDKHETANKN